VRLLLCMNVKNEARVIERCLDSALSIADGWVICDTGSTDATVDVVHSAAARWGRPGRVVHHPWRNFGFNRTLSAQAARAQAEEWGWSRERTYLLLLDADMIVEPAPEFDKQALEAAYYEVVQDTGALSYLNTRLASIQHFDNSGWATFRIFHTFSGSRYNQPASRRDWAATSVWVFAMDALAAGLIVMVLGSYYMWWRLKPKRQLGLIVLTAGYAACAWFFAGFL